MFYQALAVDCVIKEQFWNRDLSVSAYLFLIPFSTIFITQLAPLSLLSPYVSLCFPMSPYVISTISTFFPYTADTHTPFPLILLMTIHKIPRERSIGSQLWTT